MAEDQKQIIDCPQCGGKLRVPVTERLLKVKCPHCSHAFEHGIPDAEVLEGRDSPPPVIAPATPRQTVRTPAAASEIEEFFEDYGLIVAALAVIFGLAGGILLGGAPFGIWPEMDSFWTWLWKTGVTAIIGALVLFIGALILGFLLALPLALLPGERMMGLGFAAAFFLGGAIWIGVLTAFTWAWLGHGTDWREQPYQWAQARFPVLEKLVLTGVGDARVVERPKSKPPKTAPQKTVQPRSVPPSQAAAPAPAAPVEPPASQRMVDGLPVNVVLDRYLATARNSSRDTSLTFYEKALALSVAVPNEVYFEYGRALVGAGKIKGKQMLAEYLRRAGQGAAHYQDALLELTKVEELEAFVQKCEVTAVERCRALQKCGDGDCYNQRRQLHQVFYWESAYIDAMQTIIRGSSYECRNLLSSNRGLKESFYSSEYSEKPFSLQLNSGTHECISSTQAARITGTLKDQKLASDCRNQRDKYDRCVKINRGDDETAIPRCRRLNDVDRWESKCTINIHRPQRW